jgi:uncharacterized protein YjiS (DUF1127 family)
VSTAYRGQLIGPDKIMTTTLVNPYRVLGASAASRGRTTPATGFVGRLLHRATGWLGAHRRYQQTLDELSVLSDRELDDIGLTRGDIETVARRCAHHG